MRGNTTIHQHQDRVTRRIRSMQAGFCLARIERATRTQRTLRLLLRQVEKQYASLIDGAWQKRPGERRHRRHPVSTGAAIARREAYGIAQ